MNVVFVSPHFPPQFHQFCSALRERGVNVLGLGDTPADAVAPEVHAALSEYYFAPLERYEEAYRALAYFCLRYGRIDRIESHNEHWLGLEARLREDFNIPGPRPEQMGRWRTKSGMAGLFRAAGVPYPETRWVSGPEGVRAFAEEVGYPLVLKPDLGVGAFRTWRVDDEAALSRVLAEPLEGYLAQPFVEGRIVTYDGLVDGEGRILFETSHAYSHSLMDVVGSGLDSFYWNRRVIPEALRELGMKTVAGFGLRERFFHIEFFELPEGGYRALEINVRPPGGFTVDMMNFSADVDLYRLWAQMLTGERVTGPAPERKYHCAHVTRRWGRSYRYSPERLRELLGEKLLVHRAVPRVLADAMGDEMFLVRDPSEGVLLEVAGMIQATV